MQVAPVPDRARWQLVDGPRDGEWVTVPSGMRGAVYFSVCLDGETYEGHFGTEVAEQVLYWSRRDFRYLADGGTRGGDAPPP